jgi:hypothetical protein
MATDAQLLDNELWVQQEVTDVEGELGLPRLLGDLGLPVRVGSSALGVMVRRDLDFTVICTELPIAKVADAGAQLVVHHDVRSVLFRNDTGTWNADPT